MADSKMQSVTVKVGSVKEWFSVMFRLHQYSRTYEKAGCCLQRRAQWVYRGQPDDSWAIASSFERAVGKERWKTELDDSLQSVELESLDRFRRTARVNGVAELQDDVDWLAYMQHHGAPTRLVDFTELPLVALYFATYGLDEKNITPHGFSVFAFRHDFILGAEFCRDEYQDKAERINDKSVDPVREKADARMLANWLIDKSKNPNPANHSEAKVISIYPQFGNRRLEAQAGLFLMQTHFGSAFVSDIKNVLECADGNGEVCCCSDFSRKIKCESYIESLKCLRFDFPERLRSRSRDLLDMVGVNHQTIFPDLKGLGMYVKEDCFVKADDVRVVERQVQYPVINIPKV